MISMEATRVGVTVISGAGIMIIAVFLGEWYVCASICRVAVIVCACVIVIAVDFSVDTPSDGATILGGACVMVVATNRSENTS